MGGKASRDKGTRAELLVRDALRKVGYEADRVPLSGAAQGFKGDVRARKNGKEFSFEVKSRAAGFTTVYQLFARYAVDGVLCVALGPQAGESLLRICDSADAALASPGHYAGIESTFYGNAGGPIAPGGLGERLRRKLLNMRRWLGTCDVLVIKDDRAPNLYLRYL